MTAKIVPLNTQAKSVILYVVRDDPDKKTNSEDHSWGGMEIRQSYQLKIIYRS